MASTRKWRSFLALAMTLFLFHGCLKSLGVILEGTVDSTNSNVPMVGWSLMTLKGLVYIIAPVASCLMDIFPHRWLAVFGGFAAGAGFLCQAYLANNIWKLFLANTISGVGFGTVLLITTLDLARTYGEGFGTAFNICTTISSIGVMGMPVLLDHWLQTYGFSPAVALFGALLWNTVPFGQLLLDDGGVNEDQVAQPPDENASSFPTPRDEFRIQKTVFSAHPVLFLTILMRLLNTVVLLTWVLYLVPLGTSKGYDASQAVFLSSIAGAGLFVGKLLSILIYYFEFMNNIPLLLSGSFVTVACMATFALAHEFYQLSIATFVTAAIMAFYSSWVIVHVKEVVCYNHFKSAMAWSNVTAGIGLVTTGLISGLVQSIRGSYSDIFIYLTLVSVLQTLCFIPTVVWLKPSTDCK